MPSTSEISTDLGRSALRSQGQSYDTNSTQSLSHSIEEPNSKLPEQKNQERTQCFSKVLNIKGVGSLLKKTTLQRKTSSSLGDISSPNRLKANLETRADQRNLSSPTNSTQSLNSLVAGINSDQKEQIKPKKTKWFSKVLNIKSMGNLLRKTLLHRRTSTSLDDISKKTLASIENISKQKTKNSCSKRSQEYSSSESSSSSLATGATAASVAEEEQRRTAETITRNSMSKQKELAAEFDFLVEEQRWLTFVLSLGTKSSRDENIEESCRATLAFMSEVSEESPSERRPQNNVPFKVLPQAVAKLRAQERQGGNQLICI